jgi:glucose-6-phosphate 1-epimerase
MSSSPFQPITLRTAAGASASLFAYGAHLTSWCAADGREHLFTSTTAELRAGAAIRGGVPIVFPQFAGLGPLPKHGFARTALWQVISASGDAAELQLRDDDATRAYWPYQFVAQYRIKLDDTALSLTLSITNTGTRSFSFTSALHSYLRVHDIAQVSITGLQGLYYNDSANGGVRSLQPDDVLRIEGEVDRIYLSATQPIRVIEPGQRTVECRAEGFDDTVIWNPGAAKAAALTDLETDGYRQMVCVEAASIGKPVVLTPNLMWTATQHLLLV